jgi:hypothetical protein
MTYQADQFGMYLSLAVHGGVPVDFVDEVAAKNATVMATYKVLIITEPNVPKATIEALAAWVDAGGALVLSGGAAVADEYNTTDETFAQLTGCKLDVFSRRVLPEVRQLPGPSPLPFAANGTVVNTDGAPAQVQMFGDATLFTHVGEGSKTLGTFDGGAPAVVQSRVGSGSIVQMAWQPGLSYLSNATQEYYVPNPLTQFPAAIRDFLRGLLGASYAPPVVASVPAANDAARVNGHVDVTATTTATTAAATVEQPAVGIETVLLASDAGAVVSIVNWGGAIALNGPMKLQVSLDAAGCFPGGVADLGDIVDASTGQTLTFTSVPCGGGAGKSCVAVDVRAGHANFVVLHVRRVTPLAESVTRR